MKNGNPQHQHKVTNSRRDQLKEASSYDIKYLIRQELFFLE